MGTFGTFSLSSLTEYHVQPVEFVSEAGRGQSELHRLPKSKLSQREEIQSRLGKGSKKNLGTSMVFCQTGGGGGVSEGDEKPNCFFEKSIFQRVS